MNKEKQKQHLVELMNIDLTHIPTIKFGEWLMKQSFEFHDSTDRGTIYRSYFHTNSDGTDKELTMVEIYKIYLTENK